MHYVNDNYGEGREALTVSPYFEDFKEGAPVPPPGDFFLVSDDGYILTADEGDYLVTP